MIEPNHSTIGFSLKIAEITRITGKFRDYQLDMDYIDDEFTKSNFLFTINVESLTTGIPDRDGDLMSEVFFDAEQYPQISFESNEIVRDEKENEYLLNVILTMKGISNKESIPFRVTGWNGSYFGIRIRWKLNPDRVQCWS